MGDSITQGGWAPGGYPDLVLHALEQQGRKVEGIPAGVSGNTSKDMLDRLDRDVLKLKPDWMTLSCGVNDVHRPPPTNVTLEEYKKNVTAIVDQATAAGVKVMILTPTMVQEDQTGGYNQVLVPYNDFLRSFAAERHLPLADLNAAMQAAVIKRKAEVPGFKGYLLTVDGIHMNCLGNEVMAVGVLKGFGFTDAQVAQAKATWLDQPSQSGTVTIKKEFTARQYFKLQKLAAKEGLTVEEFLNAKLAEHAQAYLNETHSSPPGKP